MKLKNFFLTFSVFLATTAQAQDYFSITKHNAVNDASLQDKAALVITSKLNNLVITTNSKDDQQSPSGVKNAKGLYDYTFRLDISKTRERNFTVSKQGTVYRTTITKKGMKAGERYGYTVNEVEQYISLDKIGDLKEIYKEKGKENLSAITFTTTLKNVKINYDKQRLPATFSTKKTASGADMYVLEIRAEELKAIIANYDKANQEFESFDKALYTDKTLEFTDENDKRWTELKDKAEKAQQDRAELLSMTVSVPGSNVITVPVDEAAAIRLTGLQQFAITPKTEKEYVDRFFSQYQEMIHQAESHKASRNYDLAKQFYENAAKCTDASDADKAVATAAAQKMGELATFKGETDEIAGKLFDLTKRNEKVNKQVLFGLIDDVASRFETLNRETGDASYLADANRLRAEKDKFPMIVMGRFVFSEYKGGKLEETSTTNVRISGVQPNGTVTTLATITEADGRFKFEFKAGQYTELIFNYLGGEKVKDSEKHIKLEGNKDRNIKIRFPK